MQVGNSQSTGNWDRIVGQRKREFALCLSWDVHLLLPLDISIPSSWGFRVRLGLTPWLPWLSHLWAWTGFTPPASLGLQLADSRLWDFSTSIGTWANSYYKFPLIHVSLSILLVLSCQSPSLYVAHVPSSCCLAFFKWAPVCVVQSGTPCHIYIPPQGGGEKERHSPQWCTSRALTSHLLGLGPMATPSCEGGWRMWSLFWKNTGQVKNQEVCHCETT